MAVAIDVVSLVRVSHCYVFFPLFWSFLPYLLLFQGIKNFMVVLKSSRNGGDPENSVIGLEGRERGNILVQDADFCKNSSALMCILCVPVALKLSIHALYMLYTDCTVSNFQKSSMVRLARYKAK